MGSTGGERTARHRIPAQTARSRGNASLTAQQRQIAELAAAGLSNKQIAERLFLSPRTVGYHLYQIFPKLGVTSRAALRDALAALPADGDAGRGLTSHLAEASHRSPLIGRLQIQSRPNWRNR